jgi:hypothetical protein
VSTFQFPHLAMTEPIILVRDTPDDTSLSSMPTFKFSPLTIRDTPDATTPCSMSYIETFTPTSDPYSDIEYLRKTLFYSPTFVMSESDMHDIELPNISRNSQ